ncbi:MAG: tRNA uridine-5-carboxymethylaminomethyl(34) synthesis enzyme MnmG, partial [Rhodomicrobium sp.]
LTPDEAAGYGIALNRDGRRRSAFDLLAFPDMSITGLCRVWPDLAGIPAPAAERLQVDARYAVYMDRQEASILAFKKDEAVVIPAGLDFAAIAGLSNEIRQKLERHRPSSLAQASRIDGITPAALMLVLAHIRKSTRAA